MSLCSTYVESQEKHWYQDPVVRGTGWFICWDDDEPIELVIAKGIPFTVDQILKDLKDRGWDLRIMHKGHNAQRIFDGDHDFRPASSYFLHQGKRGPTDAILEGNKVLKDFKPFRRDGVYYTADENGNGGKA